MQAMESVVNLSIRQPARLAWLALLIAAGAMLLSASGAQAAANRGAVLVKDISPGNPKRPSSSGGPSELANVAGTLYFAAYDRRHGVELWRSDGTRKGTRMVKDINPGQVASFPGKLTAVGKTLYFTARDSIHGPELWRSDGTLRGTRMVKDIRPGRESGNLQSLTNVAGSLFFVASDGMHSGLWRSDGTEAGTTLVKEFGQSLGYLTAAGGTLYFATDGGLWRSDGTASGTVLVKEFQGGPCGGGPCYLTDVADTVFFAATYGTQTGLWRSDGTEAGTTLVNQGTYYELTAVGGTLYFATIDYSDSWLWRSDGTDAGTVPIVSVGATPEGCYCGLEITGFPELTNVGGTLFFFGAGGLSRTDGTPNGTKVLQSGFIASLLTAADKTLYFEGSDKSHGDELWRSDGTPRGTRMVRDIRRGRGSSHIWGLTAVGRSLFFNANDGVHGHELWRAGPKPCKKAKGKCKKG
jgi:ELWxxDGT repeat protein